MKWNYYSPEFECDKINVDLLRYSPWSGHRNFIYDLMANWKPHTVVELGSYYGCSAFAIAQAIKDFQLLSVFYGVDTWRGDDFTQTDYQQDVYHDFCKVKDACYSDKYVKMLRMTFDEAVSHFRDETIDLLHIDGSHHYEDVQHDFVTWKNKVKKDGIILFHDISPDKIDGQTMGSCQFWRELTEENPYHLQFDFSMGLGILFLCEETYEEFKNSYVPVHYQALNNTYDVELKDEMRKAHFKLLDADFYISSLKEQIEIKDTHLRRYEKSTQEKDLYISRLENAVEQVREDYQRTIDGKDNYIANLEAKNKDIEGAYLEIVAQKDADIEELKHEKKRTQEDYQKTIDGKNNYISELELGQQSVKDAYADTILEKDAYIKKLETDVKCIQGDYQKTIDGKNSYILKLEREKENTENAHAAETQKKNTYIKQLESTVERVEEGYRKTLQEKDDYISNLELERAKLKDMYDKVISQKDEYINQIKSDLSDIQSAYDDMQKEHEERILESDLRLQQLEAEKASLCNTIDSLQQKYQKTIEYKVFKILLRKK